MATNTFEAYDPTTGKQTEVREPYLVDERTGDRVAMPTQRSIVDQPAVTEIVRSQKVYYVVDEMPHFPGCDEGLPNQELQKCAQTRMLEFVYANIKYPEAAQRGGVEGTSVVSFVVGTDGELLEPKVVRDVGGGTSEEVLRMIREMPAWVPGREDGRDVQVRFNLPIKFQME